MAIFDFECPEGHITESVQHWSVETIPCKDCGKDARKIISASGQYCGNQDAAWIKSVLDVVDKTNPAKHVQEFIKSPTRKNYRSWMKGEGLRPLESNEPTKPPPVDLSRLHRRVWDEHRKRKKIILNRR